jgi:probable HAF family extracellular repeat protein
MCRFTKSAIVCSASLTFAAAAFAANEYTFTLVDSFITTYDLRECYLWDINNQNQACGTATIAITNGGNTTITYTGFYWQPPDNKTAVSLSWPKGISDSGFIAAVQQVYDINTGQATNVPLLPSTYYPLVLLDVNDGVTAVGYVQTCNCSNSQGTLQIPYVWDAVNGARSLPVPGAKGAAKINNNGQIVGWTGGNSMPDSYFHDLNTNSYIYMSSVFAEPNVKTTAVDLTDEGVVVGQRLNWNGTISWGYTWSAANGVTLLPLPSTGYQPYVKPSAVNRHGQVVGSIYLPNASSRAFVYDPARDDIRDLNTLTTPSPGFTMMTATKINDNGWIVGYGYGGGGMYKSFVLKPIVIGDATGDGIVNVNDLLAVITAWGACTATCSADVNSDGTVNVLDLLTVINHWN